jgi:hypothetical protein
LKLKMLAESHKFKRLLGHGIVHVPPARVPQAGVAKKWISVALLDIYTPYTLEA